MFLICLTPIAKSSTKHPGLLIGESLYHVRLSEMFREPAQVPKKKFTGFKRDLLKANLLENADFIVQRFLLQVLRLSILKSPGLA